MSPVSPGSNERTRMNFDLAPGSTTRVKRLPTTQFAPSGTRTAVGDVRVGFGQFYAISERDSTSVGDKPREIWCMRGTE